MASKSTHWTLRRIAAVVGLLMIWLEIPCATLRAEPIRLKAAASPVDNPLKGLVPYVRPATGRFPHSLEFQYLPLSQLMIGPDQFDWKPLESLLDDVASRGNQTVFRVFLEYPGKAEGIPSFLVKAGLKVHVYQNTNDQNTNTAPLPSQEVRTPDYEDPRLRELLRKFILALGRKYDGDPRIGFVTAGLLGTWGEWHTYPRHELWASKATQTIVLDAYETAFSKTPILLRYPTGEGDERQAANAHRPFGYHDDSFAWATLPTGKREDDWYFLPSLKAAGPRAEEKWKTKPIGGEIRPEVWGKIFDEQPGIPQAQDFARCVAETHVTWLMDSGLFQNQADAKRYERAVTQVRKLGYDFFVSTAEVAFDETKRRLTVRCELLNQGVAPFYQDWPLELALVSSAGKVVQHWPLQGKLTGLLPGDPARVLTSDVNVTAGAGEYAVAVRAIHPLPNGKPLRFANADQDRDALGWLTIGHLK